MTVDRVSAGSDQRGTVALNWGCLTWEVFGFRNLREGCVPRTRRGPTWFNGRTQPCEDQRERHAKQEVTR
jgi:hypothetical protein